MQEVLKINVTLTAEQKRRITAQVVDKNNVMKACQYADISYPSFTKALAGSPVKSGQRDKLIQFCDLVEGKTAA